MVCDASVMPTIPCANLNVPAMMIAEKTAETARAAAKASPVAAQTTTPRAAA